MGVTFMRPYESQNPITLLTVAGSGSGLVLTGLGFASDLQAFAASDSGALQQLSVSGVTLGETVDTAATDSVTVPLPYSVYVSSGTTVSNAIRFVASQAQPVTSVLVDGVSVVSQGVASIDLSGRVPVSSSENVLYGTDAQGSQTVYSLSMVEGVQSVSTSQGLLTPDNGTVTLPDYPLAKDTVAASTQDNILYGTDSSGNQTTIAQSVYATQAALSGVQTTVSSLNSSVTSMEEKLQSVGVSYPSSWSGNLAAYSDGQLTDSSVTVSQLSALVSAASAKKNVPVGTILTAATAMNYENTYEGTWTLLPSSQGYIYERTA